MANKKINLKIITPEKILVEEEVDAVYSRAVDGEFAVLPYHISFMTALDVGVTKFVKNNSPEYASTIGGVFQVVKDNVIILSNAAELGSKIDIPRARAAMERAEARLRSAERDVDTMRAESALHRAIARIQAASGTSHR